MTTISGHNQIIQQSGIVQEISQQAHSPKPSPDQAALVQQAQQKMKNSTVLESEESERLKKEKEKQAQRRLQKKQDHPDRKPHSRKKSAHHSHSETRDPAMDLDVSGQILDTTA
ncbi:MAG: hypothetical protein ABR534_08710 [Desulfotignum sp.]